MDILEFLDLDNDEQWEIFWAESIHIEDYESIDCAFSLYGLFDFFFEIELCVNDHTIIGKNIFKTGSRLEKYMDREDLHNLL